MGDGRRTTAKKGGTLGCQSQWERASRGFSLHSCRPSPIILPRQFRPDPNYHTSMPDEPIISRGFRGRRAAAGRQSRIPPGQYEERDFPVLSAGPTPHTPLSKWDFTVRAVDGATMKWTWDELQALPHENITRDIHCVTKWTKLDTVWEGISVDT